MNVDRSWLKKRSYSKQPKPKQVDDTNWTPNPSAGVADEYDKRIFKEMTGADVYVFLIVGGVVKLKDRYTGEKFIISADEWISRKNKLIRDEYIARYTRGNQ